MCYGRLYRFFIFDIPYFFERKAPPDIIIIVVAGFIHFQIFFEPSKIYFMALSNCYSTQMIGGLEL